MDQRKRDRRPMHLGKSRQLVAHLLVAMLSGAGVQLGRIQQAVDHVLAGGLQPVAHGLLALPGDGLGLRGGHHGHEAVG